MDEEQWAELLKLREKASLSPPTDSHLQPLEIYLSALHTLSLFSQNEKERLTAQFNDLSSEDKQALSQRVACKTQPSFFHLTDDEMEKLQAMRQGLSFHERARLSSKLILTATGTAWLDLGDIFEAQIEIDSKSSTERESEPYARISYYPSFQNQVETIDIIKSVKNNPLAIGHPAILYAVYNWLRAVHAKRVIERDDVTSRDELGQIAKQVFGGARDVENAVRNLESISKALIEGAKERALSNQAAFAANVELLGLQLEDTDSFLYKAWERLTGDFIERVLEKIEAELTALERSGEVHTPGRITIARVMEFLRDGGRNGGKRYVGNNKKGVSRRPPWKVFRNAFLAWFYGLDQRSVQQYLEDAAKEAVDIDQIFQPSFTSHVTTVHRMWQHILATPLAIVSEPDVVSETDQELK
jgi:hypothetical protein